MPTPVVITNFSGQVISPNGGGLCSSLSGTGMSIDTSILTPQALKCTVSAAASFIAVNKGIAGQSIIVGRVYIYFPTSLPTSRFQFIMGSDNGSNFANIEYDTSTNFIRARHSTGATQNGINPSVNTLYRIDFRFDFSGTTHTIDWQIDGVAQTQVSQTGMSATQWSNIRIGCGISATGTCLFQHLVLSATSGDYPIGPGNTVLLKPNADGTHSNPSGYIQDNDGFAINGTTRLAYSNLNNIPPSASQYVKQTEIDTTGYAEILFENLADKSVSASSIIGAMGYLAYTSAATQANLAGLIMSSDSFSTSTPIHGSFTDGLKDYSDGSTSNLFYKSEIVSGVDTTTEVDALKARLGYSGDANPDPYWVDVWVEVAYVEASGTQYTQDNSGGITPSGTVAKQINKAFTGGITPSGALFRDISKLLTGGLTPVGTLNKQLPRAFEGTLTSGGTLAKQTNKTLLGALSSIVGTLSTNRGYTRSFTGDITPTGAVTKAVDKILGSILAPSGSINKQTNKLFGGTLTFSGALEAARTFVKALAGTLTLDGTLSRDVSKALSGTLSSAGSIIKSALKSLSGNVTPSGAVTSSITFSKILEGTLTLAGVVNKQAQKAFSGTLTSSGTLIKQALKFLEGGITPSGSVTTTAAFTKILEGTLTLAGTVSKQTSKFFSGILTLAGTLGTQLSGGAQNFTKELEGALAPAGTLVKNTAKTFAGTLTSQGVLLKTSIKNFSGTLTSSGALVKTALKSLAGTITSSGSLSRDIRKLLSGVLEPQGTLNKASTKAFSGTLSFIGTVAKQAQKFFSGNITPSGVLTAITVFFKELGGTLGFTGTISKDVFKGLTGNISPLGTLNKLISKTFSGTLNFLGSLISLSGVVEVLDKVYLLGSQISKVYLSGSLIADRIVYLLGQIDRIITLRGRRGGS